MEWKAEDKVGIFSIQARPIREIEGAVLWNVVISGSPHIYPDFRIVKEMEIPGSIDMLDAVWEKLMEIRGILQSIVYFENNAPDKLMDRYLEEAREFFKKIEGEIQ